MPDTQDVETLKRRGRRRLVGAIALVLAAVIILPMVFDTEPRKGPPVSVRIPSEDDPSFKPKVVPKPAPAPAPAAPAPEPAAKPAGQPEPKPEPRPEAKPEPKPDAKAEAKAPAKAPAAATGEAERKRAEAALAGAEQFIVPVAALASADKLKELTDALAAAKIPHYTEPIATAKGTVTRVRAGPYASRAAAEKALQQLKGLGLKPGNVTTR